MRMALRMSDQMRRGAVILRSPFPVPCVVDVIVLVIVSVKAGGKQKPGDKRPQDGYRKIPLGSNPLQRHPGTILPTLGEFNRPYMNEPGGAPKRSTKSRSLRAPSSPGLAVTPNLTQAPPIRWASANNACPRP